MGGPAGAGVPPPGQGAAEADRLGRVPQHAVQLHAGQRRGREVRRHARTPERGPHRPRPAAARPGLGDQPRRPGRGLGPVPHRGDRGAGRRGPHPEPPGPARVRREREVRRAEPLRPRRANWSATGTPASTSSRSSCGPSTPPRAGGRSASPPCWRCAAPCSARACGAGWWSSAGSTWAAPSTRCTTPIDVVELAVEKGASIVLMPVSCPEAVVRPVRRHGDEGQRPVLRRRPRGAASRRSRTDAGTAEGCWALEAGLTAWPRPIGRASSRLVVSLYAPSSLSEPR